MNELQTVLMRAYRLIQDAIYSDDGADGDEGQAILDDIRPMLSDGDRQTLDREDAIRETMPET